MGAAGLVFASNATAVTAGNISIGSGAVNTLSLNVPTGGSADFRVNNVSTSLFSKNSNTDQQLRPTVALGDSATQTLMVLTSRVGRLSIFTSTGLQAFVYINGTSAPVILTDSSASFVVSASPTATQIGLNVSASNLQIIAGSSAACSYSSHFVGH